MDHKYNGKKFVKTDSCFALVFLDGSIKFGIANKDTKTHDIRPITKIKLIGSGREFGVIQNGYQLKPISKSIKFIEYLKDFHTPFYESKYNNPYQSVMLQNHLFERADKFQIYYHYVPYEVVKLDNLMDAETELNYIIKNKRKPKKVNKTLSIEEETLTYDDIKL